MTGAGRYNRGMRPEIILLDCGGTLSWPPFARVNAICEELKGVTFPEEKAYEGFYRSGHALDAYLREHRRYPVDDNLALNHWVYEQGMELTGYPGMWTMECTMELLRREGRMGNWDHTFPWVGESLAKLKRAGYRLGVVSNSDGHVAELLAGLGYADYFETIVDSYIEKTSKPDPRIFYIALERMGRPDLVRQAGLAAAGSAPNVNVLYVGDNLRADLIGAESAGLKGLLLDPFDLYDFIAEDKRTRDMRTVAEMLCGEAG